MSEDIDFTEIDQLMAEMEEDSRVEKAIEKDTDKVVSRVERKRNKAAPSGKKLAVDIVGGHKIAKHANGDIDNAATEKREAREQSTQQVHGKFMDMVHPMSDMTMKVRPDRKSAPIRSGQGSSDSETDQQVVTEVEEIEIIRERRISSVVPTDRGESPEDEFDRLLDEVASDNVGNTEENEAPFLENIQVEKRPLGGGAPIQKSIRVKNSTEDIVDDIANFDDNFLNNGEPNTLEEGIGRSDRHFQKKDNKKPAKKFDFIDFILKVILAISVIVLGVTVGWMIYMSGIIERIF